MPGMSAYALCRSIRQQPEFATLPVMLITALAVPEERIRGIQAGATDFIAKPFNKGELLARLETRLRLARLEHNGVPNQLEGLILAKPNWHVIGLPPLAFANVAESQGCFADVSVSELLKAYRIEPALADLADKSDGVSFILKATASPLVYTGWYTPVTDRNRRPMFRVLSFSNAVSPDDRSDR